MSNYLADLSNVFIDIQRNITPEITYYGGVTYYMQYDKTYEQIEVEINNLPKNPDVNEIKFIKI
jgi:hypothetical protein